MTVLSDFRIPPRPLSIARASFCFSRYQKISSAVVTDIPLAGAILDEPLRADEGPKIKGSVMLASADTEAEVVEQLKQDTYFKSGVWDWDKVQILPVSLSSDWRHKRGFTGDEGVGRFG